MKLESIIIRCNGVVSCKSCFYSSQDVLSCNNHYTFFLGTNKLIGDIDSGNWAVSYFISMYTHSQKDFVLFDKPQIEINGQDCSYKVLSDLSVYMDRSHPLFSNKKSIKSIVSKGLKKTKSNLSCDDIKNMFQLDEQRFERPISQVGNEVFRAMAAIGYAHEKEIFCFPWLSKERFDSYRNNLADLLPILEKIGKIAIIPIGYDSENL